MDRANIDITALLNPIYQQMGAAVQDSQRLELYISFIVTLLIDLSGGTLSEKEFQVSMENLGAQTLGRLMEEIKKKVGFTDSAVTSLRKALKARNFLIHRFYNERSDLLLSQAGRERALKEIREKREAINAANAMLDPVMNDLIQLKGIDMKEFRHEVEQRFET
jgi:thermostable 8-oxoguanine DNA glycosylase